ncbi:MAG: 50S ribosomal protein L18 [Dehalococcoidia bacterium]|nr:50S ribosomal protein L18 [Dehalococcoidia bacterium]
MSKKTRALGRNKRHLRVRKRLSGTQERPRVSLFRSNKNIYLQLIDDSEGKTLASASSLKSDNNSINKDLSKKLGIEFGEKISKLGIKKVVFDRGGYLYHGKVAAIADGIRQSGIEV